MSKKREPIITLQMPMSAVLIAEVLQGVATLAQQGDSVKSAAWLNNQDCKGVI